MFLHLTISGPKRNFFASFSPHQFLRLKIVHLATRLDTTTTSILVGNQFCKIRFELRRRDALPERGWFDYTQLSGTLPLMSRSFISSFIDLAACFDKIVELIRWNACHKRWYLSLVSCFVKEKPRVWGVDEREKLCVRTIKASLFIALCVSSEKETFSLKFSPRAFQISLYINKKKAKDIAFFLLRKMSHI